jgi:hypothetical protein
MRGLPIADCRLPINGSFTRRSFARCGHDGREFVGFCKQGRQFLCRYDAGFGKQFEPQRGFVSFFLDCSDLGNELRLTARPATGAVVGRHGSSTPHDLLGYHTACVIVFGDRPSQLDDSQGKGFGSEFQFAWIHTPTLQTQSAIGNRQSAIKT